MRDDEGGRKTRANAPSPHAERIRGVRSVSARDTWFAQRIMTPSAVVVARKTLEIPRDSRGGEKTRALSGFSPPPPSSEHPRVPQG